MNTKGFSRKESAIPENVRTMALLKLSIVVAVVFISVCFVSLHFRPFFPALSLCIRLIQFICLHGTREKKKTNEHRLYVWLCYFSPLSLRIRFIWFVCTIRHCRIHSTNILKYWTDGIALLYRTPIYWVLNIYIYKCCLFVVVASALSFFRFMCMNTFHCILRVYICVPNAIRCVCFSFLRTVAWLRLILYILRIRPSRKLASRRQLVSIIFTPLTLH